MPDTWFPEAVKYPVGQAGSLTGGPNKVTLHTTENNPEKTSAMDVCKWMASQKPGSVYHLIYHPISGQSVQMLSAAGSGKALTNIRGGVETNRRGKVHIQVSVVAFSADPFTRYPMPGWEKVVSWIESWGVPRLWYGQPPRGVLDPLSATTWNQGTGWAGHCCCPEQSHHDPGRIDLNVLFSGKGQTPPPSAEAGTFTLDFEGGGTMTMRLLKEGVKGGDVKAAQLLLNGKFNSRLAVDGDFGPATKNATVAAQKSLGITADGCWGPVTTERVYEL